MPATKKSRKAQQDEADRKSRAFEEAVDEVADMKVARMLNEGVDRMLHGEPAWGNGTNWSKMLEYLPDGASYCDPQDYARGDFKPFWDTAQAHGMQRGCGRWFNYACPIGGGMAENLANYTLGRGLHPKFEPKKQWLNDASTEVAIEVLGILEDALAANKWDTVLQREAYITEQVEGDAALEVEGEGDEVRINYQDPSWIAEPMNAPDDGLDWKYGVATQLGKSKVEAYYVAPFGILDASDVKGPESFWFTKQGTPSLVKRGMSIFYPSFSLLERAGVLSLRLAHGASIQASIAYIRQWKTEKATAGKILSNATKNTTPARAPNKDGTHREIHQSRVLAGSIIESPPGMEVLTGPSGQGHSATLVAVAEFVIRLAGARKSMPEYMSTGNAANGNYASSLVAESPFIKGRETDQARFRANLVDFYWMVVRVCCQIGLISIPYGVLRERFKLSVPEVNLAARDREKETGRNLILFKNDAMSMSAWRAAEGLDHEEQEAQIIAERAEQPPTHQFEAPVITALVDMMHAASAKEIDPEAVKEAAAALFPTVAPDTINKIFSKIKANPAEAPIDPALQGGLKDALNPKADTKAKPPQSKA